MRVMTTERCFICALSIIEGIIKVCSSTPEVLGANPFRIYVSINLFFQERKTYNHVDMK